MAVGPLPLPIVSGGISWFYPDEAAFIVGACPPKSVSGAPWVIDAECLAALLRLICQAAIRLVAAIVLVHFLLFWISGRSSLSASTRTLFELIGLLYGVSDEIFIKENVS